MVTDISTYQEKYLKRLKNNYIFGIPFNMTGASIYQEVPSATIAAFVKVCSSIFNKKTTLLVPKTELKMLKLFN